MNMISKIGLLAFARFHLGHSVREGSLTSTRSTSTGDIIALHSRIRFGDDDVQQPERGSRFSNESSTPAQIERFNCDVLTPVPLPGWPAMRPAERDERDERDEGHVSNDYDIWTWQGPQWSNMFKTLTYNTQGRNARRKQEDTFRSFDMVPNIGAIIFFTAILAPIGFAVAAGKYGLFTGCDYFSILFATGATFTGFTFFSLLMFFYLPRMSYRSTTASSWIDNIGYYGSLGMLGTGTGLVWQKMTHGADKDFDKAPITRSYDVELDQHNEYLRDRLQGLTDIDVETQQLFTVDPPTFTEALQTKADLESEVAEHLGVVDQALVIGFIVSSVFFLLMFIIKFSIWVRHGNRWTCWDYNNN